MNTNLYKFTSTPSYQAIHTKEKSVSQGGSMYYIVFDLEFNQDNASLQVTEENGVYCPFEIIQIGAVKLDAEWNTIANFSRYVKPTLYKAISPFITELTGITTEQLKNEEKFPAVYQAFLEFIGKAETIFCTWGKTDIRELFRNAAYHMLNQQLLPKQYINLQPYASLHFKLPIIRLLKLQSTVEALEIPLTHPFHDAYHDAYYTAEIMKKIYHSNMQPSLYDPIYSDIKVKPRQPKRVINFEGMMLQFEKMYNRPLTEEERGMIKIAYQMGKTNQFLKQPDM
jgi:DNA polymerase III epsilon subunit-like protein